MANAPSDVKVEKVLSQPGEPWGGGVDDNGKPKSKMRTYDEVLFEGDGQTRKVYVPEDIALVDGETVKGWYNDNKGTWTIAHPNPPQNGAGRGSTTSTGSTSRDDPTGISIERQKSADIAKDMAVATAAGDPIKMEANFEHYFDVVLAKIRPATDAPGA